MIACMLGAFVIEIRSGPSSDASSSIILRRVCRALQALFDYYDSIPRI